MTPPKRCRHCTFWTGSPHGKGEDLKRACQNVARPAFFRQRTRPGFGCSGFKQKTGANDQPAPAHSTSQTISKPTASQQQEDRLHG